MSTRTVVSAGTRLLLVVLAAAAAAPATHAQKAAPAQRPDEAYTRLIKEYTQDPRISTELVDHMPASDKVPSPLKFFGRIPGTPGELTYAKDIHRYYEALAKASPRCRFWTIGKSEEGRDMVLLAVADEATIRNLDAYKAHLNALTDPRKTTEARARQLIKTAKPVYWITAGLHSGETGGPETLIELAYRLAVEETPFIQQIRNNVIVLVTPVLEVDGKEKHVDTYYYGKKTGKPRPPMVYWGKYVAHDNNRDAMGQVLKLTQNVNRAFLEWKPTILHDLHEASNYLYTSTGTGPYNEALDAITINEWWALANTEVMEMTKRGVPGVWTYGFYDGWTANYLFYVAHTKNAVGRFYEVQSYGPDIVENLRLGTNATSREWYRPNPPLPSIKWGPRNNVNIQQSALLIALNYVGKNREVFLENYWLKNQRAVTRGRSEAPFAWVIPVAQRRKAEAADLVNNLRRQGLEISRADAPFKAGALDVRAGDYIVRADQPYRTMAEMYFSVQNFAPGNPRPYDDTGWTMPLMRNVELVPVAEKEVLERPMTLVTADVLAPGGIEGSGPVLVVDHTSDNAIVTFRFRHAGVKMLAAEEDFTLAGHRFRAGAMIVPGADRAALEPTLKELGLSAWAVPAAPEVKTHDLDVPRIGYVHAWSSTQNEGWVRAAFDHYGVPYTYFGDTKLREGRLRAAYDVIVFPHVGGTAQAMVNGIARTGSEPLPYRKSELTPNLGAQDQADDIRGGMGIEGLMNLYQFVRDGGLLIVEGATSTIFPEYKLVNGVTVESPPGLFVRGSIVRGMVADAKSPILYGYDGAQIPVYFNQDPVLAVGGFGLGGGRGGAAGAQIPGVGMTVAPNAASTQKLSPWKLETRPEEERRADPAASAGGGRSAGTGPAGTGQAAGRGAAAAFSGAGSEAPRVILRFPSNPDEMLLSGVLVGGQALAGRAQVVDVPIGSGHVVMFAIRPYWRWQTQGTFCLGFNAILNWNDLDAGR
ncbi:MAG TPA: M14 family zinc carboxypeptidase [Vicinamibacterales bacterium]|mgnify:CR=1 FL=1|nr:M14 family zinc carboxypeptidase [Vicinamibacterales bacterium]HPK70499.1 M14 family zinc carboxypeptidase [Vicinamibacterales bacterium]